MKKTSFIGISMVLLTFAFAGISPSRADAHGIGGIEPIETTAKVISVHPPTSSFKAESVENGERFKITRTGNKDIVVLGVDDEPYILLNNSGVFINQKSATRLINQSTNAIISGEELKKEFAQTSSDPEEKPTWKKVSANAFYIFHDHRTHYMGTVPEGVTDLGTNVIAIKAGDEDFEVTLEFRSAKTTFPYTPLIFLLVGVVAIAGLLIGFKKRFIAFMNRYVFLAIVLAIGVLELFHIIGYMKFAHQSFMAEVSSSIYGIVIVALCVTCIYKIFNKGKDWESISKIQSPLILATGFISLTVGSLTEYKTLYEPYLTTVFPSGVTRVMVILVGYLSTIVFIFGLLNIKHSPNTSALSKADSDSVPSV